VSSVRSPSRVYSLEQAATEAPGLAALMERARRSKELLAHVLHRIPAGLRSQIQAGPLEETQWCLLVGNQAVATKLRHLSPLLLQELSQVDAKITDIRVKIQALGR